MTLCRSLVARAFVLVLDCIKDEGKPTEHRWLEYWTGKQGDNGGPSRSPFRSDAFHFTSRRAAYECAETHNGLRDSNHWRVVPADPQLRLRK